MALKLQTKLIGLNLIVTSATSTLLVVVRKLMLWNQ